MLDTKWLELETELSLSAIQHGRDYDLLLVFKYILEYNNGVTLEQFLRTNGVQKKEHFLWLLVFLIKLFQLMLYFFELTYNNNFFSFFFLI